jgi:hypothetical protein
MNFKVTFSLSKMTGRIVVFVAFSCVLIGCSTVRKTAEPNITQSMLQLLDEKYAADKPPNKILDIVKDLPDDAPQEDLEIQLETVLSELGRSTRQDLPLIRQSIVLLRNQPDIIKAFADMYESTSKEAFQKRLVILQVVGEMQRADALVFLKEVVWGPLPPVTPEPAEGLTAREYEEVLQSKAVQDIAYLREDNGDLKTEAIEETVKIMQTHTAQAVRIAAIDAYMWNHCDSREQAAILYDILPQELHKYVERPRFYNGMNQQVFDARLEDWRKRWSR